MRNEGRNEGEGEGEGEGGGEAYASSDASLSSAHDGTVTSPYRCSAGEGSFWGEPSPGLHMATYSASSSPCTCAG